MPIAHTPLEWHLRIRILDWSLVSPFWGVFGYLILARGFGKFNSPSIAHRSHVNLTMPGAVGADKGSPAWDIIALSGQIEWQLSCLLTMNACMSVRIWADTWFNSNTLPDSEIVGENYCPHLLLTPIDPQTLKTCDSTISSDQFAGGALAEVNGRVNLPTQSLSQFWYASLLVMEISPSHPTISWPLASCNI